MNVFRKFFLIRKWEWCISVIWRWEIVALNSFDTPYLSSPPHSSLICSSTFFSSCLNFCLILWRQNIIIRGLQMEPYSNYSYKIWSIVHAIRHGRSMPRSTVTKYDMPHSDGYNADFMAFFILVSGRMEIFRHHRRRLPPAWPYSTWILHINDVRPRPLLHVSYTLTKDIFYDSDENIHGTWPCPRCTPANLSTLSRSSNGITIKLYLWLNLRILPCARPKICELIKY